MNHVGIFIISLLGFCFLAMGMDRHQKDWFGKAFTMRVTRMLRAGGWAGLLMALVIAVRTNGWSLGWVAYSGHTSVAAASVLLMLVVWNHRRAR